MLRWSNNAGSGRRYTLSLNRSVRCFHWFISPKDPMKQIVWILIASCVTPICVLAQKADATAAQHGGEVLQIKQFEEELREATLKNDVEATDRLLAEDWLNTNTNGSVTRKPQLLTLLRSAPFQFKAINDDDVAIRVFGEAAVVIGRSTRERLDPDGKVITQRVRFMRVYAKRENRWQVVAAQATTVTP
jgi:ketosteroid isomerase-like protein